MLGIEDGCKVGMPLLGSFVGDVLGADAVHVVGEIVGSQLGRIAGLSKGSYVGSSVG